MKNCPECGEILGDSVKICFKCRYDFKYNRVITNEELAEKRDRQIKQQNKQIEEAKLKEEQLAIQLSKNPLFEYHVVAINDLSDGRIDDDNVQKALNEWSARGWKLHTIFTNEIGKSSTATSIIGFGYSINATIEQTVLVFERCIKA